MPHTPNAHPYHAIFFDLDGTLLDTAADIASGVNHALSANGFAPADFPLIRNCINKGVMNILQHCLGQEQYDQHREALHASFDQAYLANIHHHSRWFEPLPRLVDRLEREGTPWGIVTNKHERFAHPLLRAMNIRPRLAALVCGDTLSRAKPHPDPLLYACEQANIAPEHCLYIGDSQGDITAARAAGMHSAAACYGYIAEHDDPRHWQADHLLWQPADLENLLWGAASAANDSFTAQGKEQV